jgi:hypothetical protein
LWQGNHLLSLNLRGHLSYLDPGSPNKPSKVIKGHNKSIESLAYHKPSNSLYTGSYDAVVTRWDETDGSMEEVAGDGHKNAVIALAIQGDNLVSAAIDDSIRVTPHGGDFTYVTWLACSLLLCFVEREADGLYVFACAALAVGRPPRSEVSLSAWLFRPPSPALS